MKGSWRRSSRQFSMNHKWSPWCQFPCALTASSIGVAVWNVLGENRSLGFHEPEPDGSSKGLDPVDIVASDVQVLRRTCPLPSSGTFNVIWWTWATPSSSSRNFLRDKIVLTALWVMCEPGRPLDLWRRSLMTWSTSFSILAFSISEVARFMEDQLLRVRRRMTAAVNACRSNILERKNPGGSIRQRNWYRCTTKIHAFIQATRLWSPFSIESCLMAKGRWSLIVT